MILSTKARTLENLSSLCTKATILPVQYFTVGEWQKNMATLLKRFSSKTNYIVRSSAMCEDSASASMAGAFESILNIKGHTALKEAIEKVIASYGSNPNVKDEILIQPMLKNVVLSGVAFSYDPTTGAPYTVINYEVGQDTAAITSGKSNAKTFICAQPKKSTPADMIQVIDLVDELKTLCQHETLDIEFALTKDGLYLLQVRPLIITRPLVDLATHKDLLGRVAKKVTDLSRPHPFLKGKTNVFGIMPDWNPAEIIGIRPRPLALSIYRDIVTDNIWAYQRDNYGYRNLRSFPLLLNFGGQPYIDVRNSFNSFIPKEVDESLANRLVEYYIDRLIKNPTLHDKVEFEIVFSCYTLDLPTRLERLREAGFSKKDCDQLSDALRLLTNRIIETKKGLWRQDEEKITTLSKRRKELFESQLPPLQKIYWLLEDCKRYGTLPFAGLARAGFIAVQILKSLVATEIFSQEDYDNFMNELNTVSTQLTHDFCELDRANFLQKYGHLRPGTYDILSPRYDEAPEQYLGVECKAATHIRKEFTLTLPQMKRIIDMLKAHGLSTDVMELFDFLKAGIELREFSKFEFTRNLSAAISLFKQYGEEIGFSAEELSYANIQCVKELYIGTSNAQEIISRSIEEGKRQYAEACSLWLPPLITSADDVYGFYVPECEPNFITQKSIIAEVVDAENIKEGAIVCIPSADPGFDWIFSHNIGGLITAYGGVNSHMAIRANELGIPAIIGAGETLFNKWSTATKLHINCANKVVEER